MLSSPSTTPFVGVSSRVTAASLKDPREVSYEGKLEEKVTKAVKKLFSTPKFSPENYPKFTTQGALIMPNKNGIPDENSPKYPILDKISVDNDRSNH